MWYKNVGTCLFRFVTNHVFNRRTDGQTDSFVVAKNAPVAFPRVNNFRVWDAVQSSSRVEVIEEKFDDRRERLVDVQNHGKQVVDVLLQGALYRDTSVSLAC